MIMDSKENTWTLKQILMRSFEVLREEGVKSLWFKILGEIFYRRVVVVELLVLLRLMLLMNQQTLLASQYLLLLLREIRHRRLVVI